MTGSIPQPDECDTTDELAKTTAKWGPKHGSVAGDASSRSAAQRAARPGGKRRRGRASSATSTCLSAGITTASNGSQDETSARANGHRAIDLDNLDCKTMTLPQVLKVKEDLEKCASRI